jgi:hypothetical protein
LLSFISQVRTSPRTFRNTARWPRRPKGTSKVSAAAFQTQSGPRYQSMGRPCAHFLFARPSRLQGHRGHSHLSTYAPQLNLSAPLPAPHNERWSARGPERDGKEPKMTSPYINGVDWLAPGLICSLVELEKRGAFLIAWVCVRASIQIADGHSSKQVSVLTRKVNHAL